ncbi:carbon-monoxide dehydrogenase catalytic subunit [Candidatus Atribacteria bacterium HGW-Atribacteria-1]|nr:MAG: carbon-monoxide dehydrogenase catalytic subunit [Candidatus Atribacteria bacterium HGW-Atribacteria-1]
MPINSYDKACESLEGKVENMGIRTVFDRFADQQPGCPVGSLNLCCKFCSMGPCRLTEGIEKTICGIGKDTLVMWNYARNVAAGEAQHAWHAYYYLDFLKQVAEGKTQFEIKGGDIAKDVAAKFNISTDRRPVNEIILDIVRLFSDELTGSLSEEKKSKILEFLVPVKLRDLWQKYDVLPYCSMPEIVKTITRTSLGVESDPTKLALQTIRLGISDLINEYIISITHNIIHGGFKFKESVANFGALEKDKVNILLQGHIPVMPSVIAELSNDKELLKYAKDAGTKGINILGVCCSGNELFGRYGIPIAGNFSQQELFIVTGVIDAFVVEQQCVMPSLAGIAEYFHTLVITTDPIASMIGAEHIPVEFDKAYDQGREIIKKAIDNFKNRVVEEISIPDSKHSISGSFSVGSFLEKVGGIDSIIKAMAEGTLNGIVIIGACTNPRIKHNYGIATVIKELMKNNILIMATGCAATGLATSGLMGKEVLNSQDVGNGLKSFCQACDIPPVLLFGSCVYNFQLFYLGGQIAETLSCTINDLPLAMSAPEWMNEKLFGIASYMLAAGTLVHIGPPPPVLGSDKVVSILTNDIKALFGGTLLIEPDPLKSSKIIVDYIKEKRKALIK